MVHFIIQDMIEGMLNRQKQK